MLTEGKDKLAKAIRDNFWTFEIDGLTSISIQEVPTLPDVKRNKQMFFIGIDKPPINFVSDIIIGELVIKRMLLPKEADYFVKWINALTPEKKNCTLKMFGKGVDDKNPILILTYQFEGCLPINQKVGSLNKSSKGWLFEEVTMSVDKLIIKASKGSPTGTL
jgi:hypothetical protein